MQGGGCRPCYTFVSGEQCAGSVLQLAMDISAVEWVYRGNPDITQSRIRVFLGRLELRKVEEVVSAELDAEPHVGRVEKGTEDALQA